jgi:hypothetical protein
MPEKTDWRPNVHLLCPGATGDGEADLGKGAWHCTHWEEEEPVIASLNFNMKGKNSCTASCPLLQLRLWQFKRAITGQNYACSLLQFGAVPNSNTQLIQYTCWFPTLVTQRQTRNLKTRLFSWCLSGRYHFWPSGPRSGKFLIVYKYKSK